MFEFSVCLFKLFRLSCCFKLLLFLKLTNDYVYILACLGRVSECRPQSARPAIKPHKPWNQDNLDKETLDVLKQIYDDSEDDNRHHDGDDYMARSPVKLDLEELSRMLPVKSVQEVTSIQEVTHIYLVTLSSNENILI